MWGNKMAPSLILPWGLARWYFWFYESKYYIRRNTFKEVLKWLKEAGEAKCYRGTQKKWGHECTANNKKRGRPRKKTHDCENKTEWKRMNMQW